MSRFTDSEHLKIVTEAAGWRNRIPETPSEMYEFAQLQYRMKDYYKAAVWYERAALGGLAPACYALALCMRRGEGTRLTEKYEEYAERAFSWYSKRQGTEEEKYRYGMCLACGIGCPEDHGRAKKVFAGLSDRHGGACYELGILLERSSADLACARYRQAYDLYYEDAIFRHFKLFTGAFSEYPYQREIKEAYSFRLGQLMRVAAITASGDSFARVAAMYEEGYPGDAGEELRRYKEKALEFRKKADNAKEEFRYGKLFAYQDSEIYRQVIRKKDMSGFGQEQFLKANL